MKKLALILIAILGFAVLLRDQIVSLVFQPTPTEISQGISMKDLDTGTPAQEQNIPAVTTIAENLEIPWDFVFLPDGDMLVNERPGNLLRVSLEGNTTTIQNIEGVVHLGEGGLLGIELHPEFEKNSWIYLYLTSRTPEGKLTNRIERYVLNGNILSQKTLILDGIAGAQYHDGGKMAFGPDGYLYVTTGDATDESSAQNRNSLAGSILRITESGEPAPGNPFNNEVYSYGHRNPQGITWDDTGQLWATEHGPSGTQTGYDELNRIVSGGNYGWPEVRGEENRPGMIAPVVQSGKTDTWAPAGIAYWDGSLFFTGLRGEALYEAHIQLDNSIILQQHFRGEFGRLRAIKIGPDDMLYLTTSNTDGRGNSNEGDDKIIRINPSVFR